MTVVIPTKRLTGETLRAAVLELSSDFDLEEIIVRCGYVDEDSCPLFEEFTDELNKVRHPKPFLVL